MPLVSVVMTSYNHDRYIASAIESVCAQTFSDLELIIIDDASTDQSRQIIRRYADQDARIRMLFHDCNEGISKTTNDGFSAARGEYIAYMQSDDLWMPEKLEKQMELLRQQGDLIVWTEAAFIDGQGRDTGRLFTERHNAQHKRKSGTLFPELAQNNFICLQSAVFSREVVREIRFDPKLSFANDYKFVLELSRHYEFCFLKEPLVQYRIHENNTIHKDRHIWDRDNYLISQYLIRNHLPDLPRRVIARKWILMGKYLCRRGHFRAARSCLFESIRYNPWKTSTYRSIMRTILGQQI